MDTNSEILEFLKAATDVERLRIIGLLSQRRASRADIAERLALSLHDVVNHLVFLEQAGVLTQKENMYELDADKLTALAREHFTKERPAAYVPTPDLDLASKKVLKAYLNADGSIRQIPTQFEKLRVILNYLIQAFEPETNYKEKDVNAILRRFHEDTAGLRRDLVDANMLARESNGSRYWRVNTGAA